MSVPRAQRPSSGDRDGVLRLVGAPPARSTDVDALVAEAQRAEANGRRAEARVLYERALYGMGAGPLAVRSNGVTPSALLRWIGRTYQVDGNPEAALDCLDAAKASAEATGDEAALGHAVNLQAIVLWHLGQLDEAERLHLEARASALRAGEAKLAAMTAQNLGVIANIRGDLPKALGHYHTSLADYRALGLAKDVAVALNNLGKVYTELKDYASAERAYDESLQISSVLGDVSTRVVIEVNVAEHWVARGDYEKAREACDRAIVLSESISEARAEGSTWKVSGVIARESGDYTRAEAHLRRGERVASERQDTLLLAEITKEMAVLYARQGRNRDTLQCLNRAHRLFTRLRADRELADVDRRTQELEGGFLDVVQRWGESIESKDRYTQGHCERVADIACALARATGMDERTLFWFRIGALLHDVGKLVVPPEVLNKSGKLTAEEWELMKRHPAAGVEMLADIEFPWDVTPLVRSHHERWDGHGYPDGVAGEEVPFSARVLCLADVYDALTSERSYKRAMTHDEAMSVMRADVGRQFDPALFELFERVIAESPDLTRTRALRPLTPTASMAAAEIASEFDDLNGRHRAPGGAILPIAEPALPEPAASDAVFPLNHADDLTGLPLRRAFLEHAAASLGAVRERPVSLLVIDVDRFKQVNDTFGHLQGDDVLRSIAGVIRKTLRTGDFAGRYAGDEFVVLLPDTTAEEAAEVGQRLCSAVRQERVPLRDREGAVLTVTLSVGVAASPPRTEPGEPGMAEVESFFAAADRALYLAKRRGRDGVASGAGAENESVKPTIDFDRFAGRVTEMRRLVQMLEAGANGAPRVVGIVGEAGVGKSTLLRQLSPEVRLRGGSLVLGRCLEADVRPPYGPWADVINALRLANAVPERAWRELPRLVPALGGASPDAPQEQALSKYVLLEEIAEYLRLASAERPVVVVLDDMQWADSATWDTLEHLLPQLEKDKLLICLTIRLEDNLGAAADRRRRLTRDERYHEIALARLTADELRQWLAAALHTADVDQTLLDFLHQHTEGNALFAVQVLRTLVDEGALAHEEGRWAWKPVTELKLPVAVTELVARRLERLSPEARTALTTAAVIGRVFDVDLAIAAGAGSEDELLDAIDEGVAAAVLEPVSDGGAEGDAFAFTHSLLADAVRARVNGRRLRRIHAQVADALASRRPDAAAEIAGHYDAAGDAAKAYDFALIAGERAKGVWALEEATKFLRMAERNAQDAAALTEARLRLADVAEGAGRYAEAEALCEVVLADSPAGRPGDAQSVRLLGVRRARERLRSLQGQPSQLTLDACRQLLVEAEEGRYEGERVALLTMVSREHSRLGDADGAQRLARECVSRAREMADPLLLADALLRLGITLLETRPEESMQLYDEALALFSANGHRYGQARCHINVGVLHARGDDAAAAERAYALAAELSRGAHAPDLGGLASINLGVMHMKLGEHEKAHAQFEQALRLFTTVKNQGHRMYTLYNMAHLARERAQAAAARGLYEKTAELARTLGQADVEIGAVSGAGLAGLVLGDVASAETCLAESRAKIGARHDWWFQGRELTEALGVLTALSAGGAALAEARFNAALALADRHDNYGAAWLVAECAPALADAGRHSVWELVDSYAGRVDALGYAPLSARYAAFTSAVRRPSGAPEGTVAS